MDDQQEQQQHQEQQEQQQEASDPADDGQPAAPAATHPPAPAPRGPTKYRGVTQLTRSNPPRWFVRLRRYDKHHTLGTFSDQKQAAEVYDAGVYVLQKGWVVLRSAVPPGPPVAAPIRLHPACCTLHLAACRKA